LRAHQTGQSPVEGWLASGLGDLGARRASRSAAAKSHSIWDAAPTIVLFADLRGFGPRLNDKRVPRLVTARQPIALRCHVLRVERPLQAANRGML